MNVAIVFVTLVAIMSAVCDSSNYGSKEWVDHVWLPSRRSKFIDYQTRSLKRDPQASADFVKSSLTKAVACNLTQNLHTNLVDERNLDCMPRKLIRPVTGLVMHHKLMYLYPSHVEVNWCTGSCPVGFHSQKSCVPNKVRIIEIPITAVIGTSPSDTESRCFLAEMEEHVSCKCDCLILEKHCDSTKMKYNESRCRCECKNSNQQPSCEKNGKVWDPIKCHCGCAEVSPCTTGTLFDPDQCTCVKVSKPTKSGYRKTPKPKKLNKFTEPLTTRRIPRSV